VPPERQSSTVEAAYRFLPARFEFLEEARLGGTAEPRSVFALEESAPPLGVLVNDLLIFNAHVKGVLVVDWRLETLCYSCLARSEGPRESVGEATDPATNFEHHEPQPLLDWTVKRISQSTTPFKA
jgi:hypothetical protein